MKIRHGRGAARVIAAGAALWGTAHAAEFSFNPYGAAQYLYDSNVYRFSSQVAEVTHTPSTEDRIERYTGGLDMRYTWQQQTLRAMGEGRYFRFEEFDHLDHSERAFEAAYDGSFLSVANAKLDVRDERRMASFEDRRTTLLIMERDQTGSGMLRVAVTPAWHVATGVRARRLHSPLPDAPALPNPPPGAPARVASPDFTLHQAALNVGVEYGIENKEHPEDEAPLLLGGVLEYEKVSFSGVTPQPAPPPGVTPENFDGYDLLSLQGTARYAVSGLSTLDAKLGLALYNPQHVNARWHPDVTGEIGGSRRFSVISELSARLFRRTAPYLATGDATTDTGVGIGAKWEPFRDLTVQADYSFATSAFRNTGGVALENSGRSDTVQNATLSLAYPQFRYMFLRVFGGYSDRNSSLGYNDFSDVTVGAELSVRWRAPGT